MVERKNDPLLEEKPSRVNELSDRYQAALKTVGRSMYSHLYELRLGRFYDSNYQDKEKKAAWSFIEKVLSFHDSLEYIDKKIFVYEFLERGRHYRFWYIPFLTERSFIKRRAAVFKKIKEELLDD